MNTRVDSLSLRALIVVVFVATFLVGCGTAPYTGRNQLLLLSNDTEASLGLQSYQETVGAARSSSRREWVEMVDRVGRRIAAVTDDDLPYDFEWEFKLIADPTVNAFALPGGKVAFYEGIMPICGDDNGVAVVMGHEIGHALARHGNERVSHGMLLNLSTEAAAAVLGSDDPNTRAQITALIGAGANVGVMLPFSRKHESEADHIGLILMAKAGYDPREAPRFWTRMAAQSSGGRPPEFLSTHPNPETRVAQLNEWMPEAMKFYKR
ncbi:MAG: hypothetical protein CMJ83_09040 [Planctomycetes bacterium]|nr:hypothetical protein [Planctomycetota bacterium]